MHQAAKSLSPNFSTILASFGNGHPDKEQQETKKVTKGCSAGSSARSAVHLSPKSAGISPKSAGKNGSSMKSPTTTTTSKDSKKNKTNNNESSPSPSPSSQSIKNKKFGGMFVLPVMPPNLSPLTNKTNKRRKDVPPTRTSFWPLLAPIDTKQEQHFRMILLRRKSRPPIDHHDGADGVLVLGQQHHHHHHQLMVLIQRKNSDEVVAVVERFRETAAATAAAADGGSSGAKKVVSSLDHFNIWGDADRTILIGTVQEMESPNNDSTVPVALRYTRQYRMYSTKPMYLGQARTRHRHTTSGVAAGDDHHHHEQHPHPHSHPHPEDRHSSASSNNNKFDILYHCADITSKPSGLLGRQQTHHMKFHLSEPKRWANYYYSTTTTAAMNKSAAGGAAGAGAGAGRRISTTASGSMITAVKCENKLCAQVTTFAASPDKQQQQQEEDYCDIVIQPKFDPLVVSLFFAIATGESSTSY